MFIEHLICALFNGVGHRGTNHADKGPVLVELAFLRVKVDNEQVNKWLNKDSFDGGKCDAHTVKQSDVTELRWQGKVGEYGK